MLFRKTWITHLSLTHANRFMREEMVTAESDLENVDQHHTSIPMMSMERDVIMSESSDLAAEDQQLKEKQPTDDYGPIVEHSLGSHRSLFSVTPVSIEYQY